MPRLSPASAVSIQCKIVPASPRPVHVEGVESVGRCWLAECVCENGDPERDADKCDQRGLGCIVKWASSTIELKIIVFRKHHFC